MGVFFAVPQIASTLRKIFLHNGRPESKEKSLDVIIRDPLLMEPIAQHLKCLGLRPTEQISHWAAAPRASLLDIVFCFLCSVL